MFTPVAYQDNENTQYRAAQKASEKWRIAKQELLQHWEAYRHELGGKPEETYLQKRQETLEGLVSKCRSYSSKGMKTLQLPSGGGQKSYIELKRLEQIFQERVKSIQTEWQAKLDINLGCFESYVHVSSTLMGKLDAVYLQHFRGDEALCLLDCFDTNEDQDHQELFEDYLCAVAAALDKEAMALDLDVEKNPQAHAVKTAFLRILNIFSPLEGRPSLPLATVSMLEDLKTCVLIGETVIPEVQNISHLQLDPIADQLNSRLPFGLKALETT